jgi:hypothetical protein
MFLPQDRIPHVGLRRRRQGRGLRLGVELGEHLADWPERGSERVALLRELQAAIADEGLGVFGAQISAHGPHIGARNSVTNRLRRCPHAVNNKRAEPHMEREPNFRRKKGRLEAPYDD